MPVHHPNDNLLIEFAAGTLPIAQAVAVKAHLHYCYQCQQTLLAMESTGGAMLETLTPQSCTPESFDELMQKIDKLDGEQRAKTNIKQVTAPKDKSLPHLINKLMGSNSLKWKKVNNSLESAQLVVGQKQYEVSLQKIRAGNSVPEHDHRGLELTVVLEGCFSDTQGIYQAGDFIEKKPGDIHQPISACHQDCLCLAVQEAPVKLTGILGRFINPFIRLNAA